MLPEKQHEPARQCLCRSEVRVYEFIMEATALWEERLKSHGGDFKSNCHSAFFLTFEGKLAWAAWRAKPSRAEEELKTRRKLNALFVLSQVGTSLMMKLWMSRHKSSCSSNKQRPMKTSASATLAGERVSPSSCVHIGRQGPFCVQAARKDLPKCSHSFTFLYLSS